ncbi:hypothetical protein [Schauerella aestuarii]|uniref:hypothetical protein n=1 Tax=Schauerella aestuarii TaxID=2511204 RepID=UPI00136B56C5|nr:hypothetical protein [Achromobacter aestuarii]MYZ42170.1 hypothetical protein [Achromobacter aestuarii]
MARPEKAREPSNEADAMEADATAPVAMESQPTVEEMDMWAVDIGCKSNTFSGAAQIIFVERLDLGGRRKRFSG